MTLRLFAILTHIRYYGNRFVHIFHIYYQLLAVIVFICLSHTWPNLFKRTISISSKHIKDIYNIFIFDYIFTPNRTTWWNWTNLFRLFIICSPNVPFAIAGDILIDQRKILNIAQYWIAEILFMFLQSG